MDDDEQARFLDLLYDAPFDPARWTPILERMADLLGANAAMLSGLSMADGGGAVEIARIDPDAPRRYFDHFALRNPLSNVPDAKAYMAGWRPIVLTDEDWMPKADLIRTEYYNDFMAPQDMHSVAMIRLATSGMDVFAISLTRPKRWESFDSADVARAVALQPHLIRAFTLSRRLACVRGTRDGLTDILDRAGQAVFILDLTGKVKFSNRTAEAMVTAGDGLEVTGGRLRCAFPGDDRRLQGLIHASTEGRDAAKAAGAMAVTTPGRARPLSITVTPIRPDRAASLFERPGVMVCVTDLAAESAIDGARLRDLFGLSPAEARVAAAIARGLTPRETAESLGVSFFTVRGHLVRIFEKTRTTGQVELTRLMLRIAQG